MKRDRERYWDEHDAHMPAIFSNLESGGDVEALAEYLARTRTLDMGLHAQPEADRRAAEAIIARNPRSHR